MVHLRKNTSILFLFLNTKIISRTEKHTLTSPNSIILVDVCIISNLTALLDESQSQEVFPAERQDYSWLAFCLTTDPRQFFCLLGLDPFENYYCAYEKKNKQKQPKKKSGRVLWSFPRNI